MISTANLSKTSSQTVLCAPRRSFLSTAGAASALALASPWVLAQNAGQRSPMVGQIADVSNAYRDISKDFVIGSRAAWQEINAAGGLRGQRLRHTVIEIDSSAAHLDAAWAQLRDDENCVAAFGTCADPLAVELTVKNSAQRNELAHVAPWLQNSAIDISRGTFPIFSTREHQIHHALKSMSTVGVGSLTVVYQSERERASNTEDIKRIAQMLKMGLREMPVQLDLTRQAQQLSSTAIPLILFVGGTPELVQFTQGWSRSSGIRSIVALAVVNLQTALQMNGARHVPVIGTQAVPIVRRYRQALAKYFDEPPTALSLAGYISARYTAQTMLAAKSWNRSSVYEAFARRQNMDLEGFRVEYDNGRLSTAYVTQSMISLDGRVVG